MKITEKHQHKIRLSETYFNYGPLIKNHGDLTTEGGFAGFRLQAPLSQPEYYDEWIVFQGSCYWRALGKSQRHGISSRGIALNTGIEAAPEEFPAFREFCLRKPVAGEWLLGICILREAPKRAIGSTWRRGNGG